jgi:uncharacterized protein (DUF2236 family)
VTGDRDDTIRERVLKSGHTQPGPDTVTWTINREIIVVAGWGRAILMQLAHPSVAAGVRDHSSFRRGLGASLQRLRSTIGAMLSIMFGDSESMIRAAAGINAIHDRVNGRVPATGATYSAHDPELLRWVHATLLDSMLRSYELLVQPLTAAERDQYCAESVIMEPLLGMPDGWLPRSVVQLNADIARTSRTLLVTDSSRALARAVLFPPYWRLAWPAFRAMQLITIGTLPAPVREAYGFDWRPSDARALVRWVRILRTMARMSPAFVRHWRPARRRERVEDLRAELARAS